MTYDELYQDCFRLLHEGEINKVTTTIEAVLAIKEKYDISFTILKVAFAGLYLDIAERWIPDQSKLSDAVICITKTLQIYRKYGSDFPNKFHLKINLARAYSLQYDIKITRSYLTKWGNPYHDYTEIVSIYDIDGPLTSCIKLYRENLAEVESLDTSKREQYNVRNNLAQALSRTGRFIEALNLFESNTKLDNRRWQSYGSYGDILQNFIKSGLLENTTALHIKIFEAYLNCLENKPDKIAADDIEKRIIVNKSILEYKGLTPGKDLINFNSNEEMDEYARFDDYRKFVLDNYLSLNEHSIYCKCNNSKEDSLRIGLISGSVHKMIQGRLAILDGYVNRILSEYCYSRYIYYNYITGSLSFPNDINFSELSNTNDELGYKIEQLRNTYRNIYSVLDKIMNSVLILFDIRREKNDYFESFFSRHRDDLKSLTNIHLSALYSLSLELNQEDGVFRYFKKTRNLMEHEYIPVNEQGLSGLTRRDLENLTFELLKLTRTAIFSLVFLIRTETIGPDNIS